MIKELCTKLLDSKMAENENFIRSTFYELRVKNNLSEEDQKKIESTIETLFDDKNE